MSGWAAIVNFDGKPVDREALGRMAEYLSKRGPDEQRVWVGGWNENVGLVHAKFATTHEAERESQPLTLDGRTWITGQIRVDAREELWDELEGHGRRGVRESTDAELVLHAHAVWGEGCVEHLLGDWSFAVWDEGKRRLFCARDQMGVRQLFHAEAGGTVVISNTLECVRLHPGTGGGFDELSVLDFLLFGEGLRLDATVYEGVSRLMPGHIGCWTREGGTRSRYWRLPIEEPVYRRRADDYCGEFRRLVRQATVDRLRTERPAVLMSGGLDSPTLAATICEAARGPSERPTAYCMVFDWLIPDEERYYSGLVARQLGIPIRHMACDGDVLDGRWQFSGVRPPEPDDKQISYAGTCLKYRAIASSHRVVFVGEPPDNALSFDWRAHVRGLANGGRWRRLAKDLATDAVMRRRVPFAGSFAGMLRGGGRDVESEDVEFPEWMAAELVKRHDLRARWREFWSDGEQAHPFRPSAYRWLTNHAFPGLFSKFDAGHLRSPLEARYPFFDVRVIRFLLSLPCIPWCRNKLIIRRGMRGVLPKACLERQKSPLRSDPYFAAHGGRPLPALVSGRRIEEFVAVDKLKNVENVSEQAFAGLTHVLSLDFWLSMQGES